MGRKISKYACASKKKRLPRNKNQRRHNNNSDSSRCTDKSCWLDSIQFIPVLIDSDHKQDVSLVSKKNEHDIDRNDDYEKLNNKPNEATNDDANKSTSTSTICHPDSTNDTSTALLSETIPLDKTSISIISWNVLADAYCSHRSHRNLPSQYRKHVFHRTKRIPTISAVLHDRLVSLSTDVICLQEVDMKEINRTLSLLGYRGIETPRSVKGNSGGRVDACAVYVNERSGVWRIRDHEIINFDDLATLATTSMTTNEEQKPIVSENGSTQTDKKLQQVSESKSASSKNLYNISTNVQGIQQSFLRRNVGLLVRLEHKDNPNITVVLANSHLFWNPAFEYVKLCQAHYMMLRATSFGNVKGRMEPFICCGDFNSRPGGVTHSYLSRAQINAKRAAPWYSTSCRENLDGTTDNCEEKCENNNHDNEDDSSQDENDSSQGENDSSQGENDSSKVEDEQSLASDDTSKSEEKTSTTITTELPELLDKLTLYKIRVREMEDQITHDNILENPAHGSPSYGDGSSGEPLRMRYLLDTTLNKFCRWLRILGQDAALETEKEEIMRTSEGKMILFDRCRDERRTLITTSTRLLHRRDCPTSVYCISPQSLPRLEVALVHMLLTHGVVLEPRTFLSRCVMCNGKIVEVCSIIEKKRILAEYQAPAELLDSDMDVYECNKCKQGYWWCDRPTSSASRVKNTACELFELCLRAGVPCNRTNRIETNGNTCDEDNNDIFQHLNEDVLRTIGWDFSIPGSHLLRHQLDAIKWMKDECLRCPYRLESAYALKDPSGNILGEILPFTNVTYDFVDTLDYIFFDSSQLCLVERLYVPKTFAELNQCKIRNGHLLPSDLWPSDHLAIGAKFFIYSDIESDQNKSKMSSIANYYPSKEDNSSNMLNGVTIDQVDNNTNAQYRESMYVNEGIRCENDGEQLQALVLDRAHDPQGTTDQNPIKLDNFNSSDSEFVTSQQVVSRIDVKRETIVPNTNTLSGSVTKEDETNKTVIIVESNPDSTIESLPICQEIPKHNDRCRCGCIPLIPSLFEMAELRRLAQKKKEKR